MPDYTKKMREYLSQNNRMRDTSASVYNAPDQVDRDYGDNLKYERQLVAEEIKKQSKKLDQELVEYGYDDKAIKKVKEQADTWNDLFNAAKSTVSTLMGGNPLALGANVFNLETKKKEILESSQDERRQNNAIKGDKVYNSTTKTWEKFSEQDLDEMTNSEKFGRAVFGYGTDAFGDKKLTIGFNDDELITKDKNGKFVQPEKKAKWVFRLDKDEEGNDIWVKTKYESAEEFKKIGKAAINAYGVTPFNKGFGRELGNQLSMTYNNMEKNAVNFGEAVATLAIGKQKKGIKGGLFGMLGLDPTKAIQDHADEYRAEFDITKSQQGSGDGMGEYMGSGIGSGVSSLAQMAMMGNAMGALDKYTKFRHLTNFGAGAVLNFNESYESALRAGLDKQNAATVGMTTGIINGLIESAVGTNKLMNFMSGGGDRALSRAVLTDLNGDYSKKAITKLLDTWKNPSNNMITKLFETPILGQALEEGVEEFSQTLSQKAVENIYDTFLADDKQVGKGKFGTEFLSKDTVMEGLEAAFFGALVGGGMSVGPTAIEKFGKKKHGADADIISFIADGKKDQIDGMIGTLHSEKLISDQQREFYSTRVEQLDQMYKENGSTFSALDAKYDEDTALQTKKSALNIINHNRTQNNRLNDLSKKLDAVTKDASITDGDKEQRTDELKEEIRLTQLGIKFYDDIIKKEYTPQLDGKVLAAENKYVNQEEIIENKWQRFQVTDSLKHRETDISRAEADVTEFQEILDGTKKSLHNLTPAEIKEELEIAESNLNFYNHFKKQDEEILAKLNDEYSEITSQEYQDKFKAKNPTPAPAAVVAPIIIPPNMNNGENENNSNKQEDDINTPIGKYNSLVDEHTRLVERLESEDIGQEEADAIQARIDQLDIEIDEMDASFNKAGVDAEAYLAQMSDQYEAFKDIAGSDAESALNAVKTDLEKMVPALEAQGVDTTPHKALYANVIKSLQETKDELQKQEDERQRIIAEDKKALENEGKPVAESIHFFDMIQRTFDMNKRQNYYTDTEVNQIFRDTPMEDILKDITVEFLDASQFMPVGKDLGPFPNSQARYVNPKKIVMIMYKGKALGNIQQFDGMMVEGKLLTEDLTDEEFAKMFLNISRDEFEASKARSLKINALLDKKGKLTVEDLQSVGFIINWNGDFIADDSGARTLIKDTPEAQLKENGGHPYIYDQSPTGNIETTGGTVNMRQYPGVPPIPVGLTDRYVVLVKANNGRFYWVGAQTQVLTDKALKDVYDLVFDAVDKYKTITDPDAQKKFAGEINRKIEDMVHVSIPNADLTFTTPDKSNPNFTIRLRTGEKGKYKYEKVILDRATTATPSAMLTGLKLNRTQARVPMANNAPARIAVTKLAINVKPGIITNDHIHKSLTFGVDESKLNDALIGVTAPLTKEEQIAKLERDLYEAKADYAYSDTADGRKIAQRYIDEIQAKIDELKKEEVVEEVNPLLGASGEFSTEEVVQPIGDILDLTSFDPDYAKLSDEDKAKVSEAVRPLVESLPTMKPIQVRGANTKIRAEIAKYKKGDEGVVFSIGSALELSDNAADLSWLKSHLPSSISIKDVEVLLGNIKNNGVTWGAYANSVIYLAQNRAKGTAYHEAFHAVFRLLMTDSQIRAAYKITEKKYGKPTEEQINKLRMSSTVYHGYTREELYNLVLEEKMANEYKASALNYMKDKETSSGLKSLWNKIRNWINFVTGNMDTLEAMFYNINRGKYKKASYKSNMFSSFANQDRVFEIYEKGTDPSTGEVITTSQSEAQGVVSVLTNKLLAQIIEETDGGTKKVSDERRNEILDKLIADQVFFYSIDDNPYYTEYLERTGKMEDEAFLDQMAIELELKRNIYALPQNIEKIKKDVFSKIRVFDIEEEILAEDAQDAIDDQGDQYDVAPWSIGGETSFSQALRQYISLVTIKRFDKYGQEYDEAVDFRKIYRGLIRALAGTEEANVLPRMAVMAEFDDDIRAVYNQLRTDIGLTGDNNDYTTIPEGRSDWWRKFVTAFNNEKVGWYTILYSDTQSRLIESNTMSNKETQFNSWFQDYVGTFEDAKSDKTLRATIDNTADDILRTVNIKVNTLNEAKEAAVGIQKMFKVLSIDLSRAYITYSILKNSDYAGLDEAGQKTLSAFAGVPGMYDDNNLSFIVQEFKGDVNPFMVTMQKTKGKEVERGAVTRIKELAEGNAIFDPTIGENSFQNADGKNVYSIIKPSFGLVKLRWIADTQKRADILAKDKKGDNFIDPLKDVRLNHLLADPNVDIILKSLFPSMIDGARLTKFEGEVGTAVEGEGVTFGKFDANTYLLTDLRMFLSRKPINHIVDGKVVKIADTSMFNINQMEASNTAYGVFMPVNDYKTINKDVLDKLFDYFAQEVIRINKVRNEFGKKETTLWKGYNIKEGDRGFKLMEFEGYGLDHIAYNMPLGLSAEEVYGTLLGDKDSIQASIKAKIAEDIQEYKETLIAHNILSEKASLLPPQNLRTLGYLGEKDTATQSNMDQFVTDFYLNAYINTLGINNLMLDNYARKVKDSTDWFKRAKGIIGSGPDLGSGITKVAVYKDPKAFIDDKLTDLSKEDLQQIENASKVVINGDQFTRQSVQEDSDTMYLFTDNAERTSSPNATEENVDKDSWYYKKYKGQTNKPIHFGTLNNPTSAVIRGLNNSYPISTMSAYGTNWTDANLDLFKSTIDDEIAQIKQDLPKFKKFKLGNYRIGQGGKKAKLPAAHQAYLDAKLLELGINNLGSVPVVVDKKANSIDVADAQSYVTLDHKILQLRRWGRFPKAVEKIYDKISKGLHITKVDYDILADNNAALNSAKTVAYNGDYYFKLSELPLTPRLVGRMEKDGTVIMENGMPKFPRPGFEYLFNMYRAMVRDGVDQALPETASKMATIKSAEHHEKGLFQFAGHIMDMENQHKRLQVETPTGKLKVTHGTQLIQLIGSEQLDSQEVVFPYNTDIKTVGDLRRHYRELMAETRMESFHQALAYIKDPLSNEFNARELTKKFYNTVIESGADEVMAAFFTPDQDGNRQFNWNLGPIINKAEQLFLAHFGKGVLAQKVAGLKVSLVSDAGIFKADGNKLKHMALDADGNYYSECMLPAFANELLGKDPSDKRISEVLKMFGVRIPTQDKHSMMSLKVVGFLPVEYGSVGIFPKEIVYLSGADFDIDSLFIHRKEYYDKEKNGTLVPYGLVTTPEEKYEEWMHYELRHNKLLAAKFKELKNRYAKEDEDLTDKEVTLLRQANRQEDISQAFRDMGLASTLEEFIAQKPINIAANNNAMLEGEIKLLTNNYVRTGAAQIPSSMDSIKAVAKIVSDRLNLNAMRPVSPNTPLARFRANRNNMEGKDGIAPVAIANSVHAFLSSNNVKLDSATTRLNIGGKVASGFGGFFTIDSDTNRKNDNISTLLSAMTDNAKEQLAKLLNLSFNKNDYDTLPVAAYMLSLGYTMEETMLFLNLPSIRAYATQDKVLQNKLKELDRALTEKIVKESKASTQEEINNAIKAYKAENIKPFSIELMIQTLNENDLELDDSIHLEEAEDIFKAFQKQATMSVAISGVMKLNKGLASSFDLNHKLLNHLGKLQLSFVYTNVTDDVESYDDLIKKLLDKKIIREGLGTDFKYVAGERFPLWVTTKPADLSAFDARLALINDHNSLQNIIIHKKVADASKNFFLLNTNVFNVSREITGLPAKDLIPFYMDKSYKTFLENEYPEKYERHQRFYESTAYMINKTDDNIGIDLANLKKHPVHKKNNLIKMLQYSRPKTGSGSGIIQIMFPTRIKAEGDFYTDLSNGFKALFTNPETTEFATRLYYYSYFKDGLQFRNRSFINTLPSWVFKDVSTALDKLNLDLANDNYEGYASIKEGIIPTMVDLLNSLTLNSKTVVKLPKKLRNIDAVRVLAMPDKVINTALLDKLKERLDFSTYEKLATSVEDLYIDLDLQSQNILDSFIDTQYTIPYRLVAKVEKINANPTIPAEITAVKVVSIKGFDNQGNSKDFNLEEIVEYALKNNGNLPKAYEVNHINIDPMVENGLNSTINDAKFLGKIQEVKKAVAGKPENLGATPGAISILEQGPPQDMFADQGLEEPESAIEDLETPDILPTFVADPFAGSSGMIDESMTVSSEDAIKMAQQYEEEIAKNAEDQEDRNELKKDSDDFKDDDNNPICKD